VHHRLAAGLRERDARDGEEHGNGGHTAITTGNHALIPAGKRNEVKRTNGGRHAGQTFGAPPATAQLSPAGGVLGSDNAFGQFQIGRKFMKHLRLLWLVIFGSLALAAAQDTNSLKTSLGQFVARTGVVIVRGYAPIGETTAGPVEISVRCKETTDVGSGEKAYGLAFEITGNASPRDRTLVDDDEIDALLDALNYVIKSNYEVTNDKVTTLTSFEASYTTKAGLRVMANSVRKEGGVQYFIQSCNSPRIPLSGVEMTQLYNLISQARKNLDDLKSGK
jgi:hypothetical protein